MNKQLIGFVSMTLCPTARYQPDICLQQWKVVAVVSLDSLCCIQIGDKLLNACPYFGRKVFVAEITQVRLWILYIYIYIFIYLYRDIYLFLVHSNVIVRWKNWSQGFFFMTFSNQILCTFLDLTRVPDTCMSSDLSPQEHQMNSVNMELVIIDVFLPGSCI